VEDGVREIAEAVRDLAHPAERQAGQVAQGEAEEEAAPPADAEGAGDRRNWRQTSQMWQRSKLEFNRNAN
jgi:hypothetical protein